MGCKIHSWHLNKQSIQVACIGQHTCDALQSNSPLCGITSDNIVRKHSICCLCYENLGGYIYRHPGRGKGATTCVTENSHEDDVTKGLEFLCDWLINITRMGGHGEIKKDLLIKTFETFLPFINKFSNSTTNTSMNHEISLHEPPSLFMIRTIFIEQSKKNKKK